MTHESQIAVADFERLKLLAENVLANLALQYGIPHKDPNLADLKHILTRYDSEMSESPDQDRLRLIVNRRLKERGEGGFPR